MTRFDAARSRERSRPCLEALEDRTVPTIFVPTGGFLYLPESGLLAVGGTDGRDEIRITYGRYWGSFRETVVEMLTPQARVTRTFMPGMLSKVQILAGEGNDLCINSTHVPTSFSGMAGWDDFYGGSGNDVAWGGDGSDLLSGRGGNDRLFGEGQADQLYGGDGIDYLDGGFDGQRDTLSGGAGADTFVIHRSRSFWGVGQIEYENVMDLRTGEGDAIQYLYHSRSWWLW